MTLHRILVHDFCDLVEVFFCQCNISTCEVLKSALLRSVLGVKRELKHSYSGERPYDDPGNGRTCGPRWATHAMASCAGVIPFFSANARIASAFARLWSKYCTHRVSTR